MNLKPKQQSYVDSLTCEEARKEAELNFKFENRRKANKKFKKSFKTAKIVEVPKIEINLNTIDYLLTDENLSLGQINDCLKFCQFSELPDLLKSFQDKKENYLKEIENDNLTIGDGVKHENK